jgi:dihydropteroate synthase
VNACERLPLEDRTFAMLLRAESWQLRTQAISFDRTPRLMGIINVTPDSFSDGGKTLEAAAAVEHGLRLVEAGADLLDVGGESTRPSAEKVDVREELRRVLPVVRALVEKVTVPVSVDTSKAAVAREAIAAGAEVVNDVTACRADPDMIPLIAETACGVCVMHMQGTPATMQQNPTYANVVEDVFGFLRDRRDALEAAGIQRTHIAVDPGIGFGKTLEHNLDLLRNARRFQQLGCPVLVGHSRKRFIGAVLGDDAADRTAGTIGSALALARHGVHLLRLHDVAEVRQAIQLFEACGGLDG